ncbi:ABC transporter permease [Actinoplanes regularis]|uniref:Transport permease protein n=1 Tax=Actinoplanes regularis TaxID=52697 RepID=A0A239BN47_9ACTN|nr:ABC transporter permease [Actinoplanes regularis]GIE88379.1 ABC transporter [Actinoplanes regularis]GLW30473.1 ABC transporter [Actinoplanes regularis]SNS09565.1 ABC-2 type transport system permease protein [Actinoplanes regularis]
MTATTATPQTRALPALGGFSLGMIALELRRLVRNKRTVVFSVIMPPAFFILFGTSADYKHERVGDGNVTGYVLISMAVYGAMLATTSGGAMVSIERAAGWSRQLRLTPLKPAAYVAVKLTIAMIIGLVSVVVVNVTGVFFGADLPVGEWIACALLAWVCALVFAAFGLFMGYLLPSENVMQILGPALALLSFAGGLFVPLDTLGDTFATVAKFTPVYGVGELARYPVTQSGHLWQAIVNVAVWTLVFSVGAMWRFRRDTARV